MKIKTIVKEVKEEILKIIDEFNNDEFFFPGVEYLDGTIKGALYAGNKAYPPM